MASTYLTTGTMGSATSRTKFTISFWAKRGSLGEEYLFFAYNASSLANFKLQIGTVSDDTLEIRAVDGGTQHTRLVTNRKFRDTNAWYHFYFAFDTTQGTASDRIKIYINGVQETSLSTSTYPNQNQDFALGSSDYTIKIGSWGSGGNYWSGSMSHYYYVDGSVIAHTQFGSTDSTTGEWKINTAPTISSYGNEGFLILKDGNTVTDQSPNSNNLTVGGGTLTKTEDNPSNVFATLNILASSPTPNFSNGNTSIYANAQNHWNQLTPATFVMPSGGKYYWEVKNTSSSHPNYINPGFMNANYYNNVLLNANLPGNVYDANNGFWNGMQGGGDNNLYSVYRAGTSSNITVNDSFVNGDILSFAVDLDNRKAWLGRNGTYIQSGNPSNGTNETWSTDDIDANTDYVPGIAHYYTNPSASFNFGNGYFGTTAVASAGTNASGNGIFEYDVPTGFTALSTKGLNL